MTADEILTNISANLAERSNSAALSNYGVLCNNIEYVNNLLKYCVLTLGGINSTVQNSLSDPANTNAGFKETDSLFPFTKIVPRILANGSFILQKFIFQTEPDDRAGVTPANVSRLQRGFSDYSSLVTTARQVVDSIVSDCYQLMLLDAKALNYHVLVSLNSFDKYVTPSIRHTLFNKGVSDALVEFRKLTYRQWENSPITQCTHPKFRQKVDFLFPSVTPPPEADLAEAMKDLFAFSSEFTHIGYVSTFFSSSSGCEVLFADERGPYLPSTENFSELKYEILVTVTRMVAQVYLPCIRSATSKMLAPSCAVALSTSIDSLAQQTNKRLKTRNAQYYFFVKNGLLESATRINLPCICGEVREWAPPHRQDELYCKACGSRFSLITVEGEGGYIITSAGPIKIIGSDVPDFRDLPADEQLRMLKDVEALAKKKIES